MTNFRKKHKGYFCGKLRKRKVKKQKPFQKLLEQISQCPQCSQRRQSQSSRGNVYGETDQEPGNRHIWKYWYHTKTSLASRRYIWK